MFGEEVKHPVGGIFPAPSGLFGSFGSPMIGSLSAASGSSYFGGGSIFGAPPIMAPRYKAPPIKYTAVSFPYSSKPA